MATTVTCPYCGLSAVCEDSTVVYGRSYGMIWRCAPCDAYVGTHKNSPTHKPLGRLANAELRKWKIRAHSVLDPMWQRGGWKRDEVYRMAADLMGIPELHIGELDIKGCQQLIALLEVDYDAH